MPWVEEKFGPIEFKMVAYIWYLGGVCRGYSNEGIMYWGEDDSICADWAQSLAGAVVKFPQTVYVWLTKSYLVE